MPPQMFMHNAQQAKEREPWSPTKHDYLKAEAQIVTLMGQVRDLERAVNFVMLVVMAMLIYMGIRLIIG